MSRKTPNSHDDANWLIKQGRNAIAIICRYSGYFYYCYVALRNTRYGLKSTSGINMAFLNTSEYKKNYRFKSSFVNWAIHAVALNTSN